MSKRFFDTSILVYAFSSNPRRETALSLLQEGGTIGVQNLNEFAAVARRKLRMEWAELQAHLLDMRQLCRVVGPLDLPLHEAGLRIARRYRVPVFDSLIVAAALIFGCDTLLSEDMHDGLVVEGALTIRNPFR